MIQTLRFILALVLAAAGCDPAYAQLSAQQRAELRDVGTLKNPGFEQGKTYWTASAGTFTVTTTAADVAFGTTAASWDASATAQTLTSDQVDVPPGGYGSQCTVKFWYKGGDSSLTARVISGAAATLVESVLRTQSVYTFVELDFACPTSSTFAFRLVSTGNAAAVLFDQVYLGVAPRRTERGPTNLIAGGDAEYAGVSSSWSTYDDGGVAVPIDGTGGTASNITPITRDTTTAQLIDGKGTWKLSKSVAADASGEGWAYDFTLPAKSPLYSSLVTLRLDYYMSTASISDAVRVYLYDKDTATLITPQFVTCGGGSTPTLTSTTTPCHAELAWVSSTSDDYRLIFNVAYSTNTLLDLYVDNLYVGEFKAAVGAAVGPWETFTVDFNNDTSLTGNWVGWKRRTGDSLQIMIDCPFTADGTNGNDLQFVLPDGHTVAKNFTAGAAVEVFENGATDRTDVAYVGGTAGDAYVRFFGGLAFTSQDGDEFGSSSSRVRSLQANFTVPVSAFSGGVAFGENKVEYAYNSDTSDASDTTSFAYGPAGVLIGSFTTATRAKRVRFQTPIQPTDTIIIELKESAADTWYDSAYLYPRVQQSNSSYGIGFVPVNGTDIDVSFRASGTVPSNSTYAGTGSAWSTASTIRWRAKKMSAGVAVGFGLASSTTPGLVDPYNAASAAPVYGDTYSATVANVADFSAITTPALDANCMRVGPIVSCSGRTDATNTDATRHILTISLPSWGGTPAEVAGTCAFRNGGAADTARSTGGVVGLSGSLAECIIWPPSTSAAGIVSWSFTYEIQ